MKNPITRHQPHPDNVTSNATTSVPHLQTSHTTLPHRHLISKPPPPHRLRNTTTPQHQQPALPSTSPQTTSPEPRETTETVAEATDRRQNHRRSNENATENPTSNHQETVTKKQSIKAKPQDRTAKHERR
ncbi:hypothetical protein QL285_092957 [Trifolium repens]|nr:hypothetical protein QL285_092957 [Trifolium repens]